MIAKHVKLRKVCNLFILSFILSGIFIVTGFAQAKTGDEPNPTARFNEANQAYQNEEFSKAATIYQELVDVGVSSGNLYYNLGNAYNKLNRTGLAVLYYEKAKRLIPWDAELQANLNTTLTGINEGEVNWKADLWETLAFFAPLSILVILSSLCFSLVCIILICLLLLPPAKVRSTKNNQLNVGWRLSLIGSGILTVIVFTFTIYTFIYQSHPQVVIIKANAIAHREPNRNSDSFELSEGARLFWQDSKGDWCLIKRKDGKRGWVEQDYLEKI